MAEFIVNEDSLTDVQGHRELIRCKDCKFMHRDKDNVLYCELPDHEMYIDDEWFCADGKPKE